MSTASQVVDGQRDALEGAGCEQIFVDVASGKLSSRPELDRALLVASRPGDELVVTRLDRLGRSLEDLLRLSGLLEERGVNLIALEQGIDTTTPTGRLYYALIGAVAEFERALLIERTREGLAAARARGRVGGRKPKLTPKQVTWARSMLDEVDDHGRRRYTVEDVARELGVSRPTIYRHLSAGGPT